MSSTTSARVFLTAVLMTAVVVTAGVLASPVSGRGPSAARGAANDVTVAPVGEVQAAAVLRRWDAARARAWAAGDVRRLGALYTPGSVAGRRDRAMLQAWLRRGLVVSDLRPQVLALREVRHGDGRWVLEVTDRVSSGQAVGRGAARPQPRDAATTTTVTQRRLHGRWRVESVSAAGLTTS